MRGQKVFKARAESGRHKYVPLFKYEKSTNDNLSICFKRNEDTVRSQSLANNGEQVCQ